MLAETETPSTVVKMLATMLFSIMLSIMLFMTNIIPTSMTGYLAALLPQGVFPEMLTPYCINIRLWFSIIITCSSYVKPYYGMLTKLFMSVGASFATREPTYESLALSEQEMSRIGGLPGPFTPTESEPETPGTSARDTNSSPLARTPVAQTTPPNKSCAPGLTVKEAPTSSGEPPPSSPGTLSEATKTKYHSSDSKERLPGGKSPRGGSGVDRDSPYAEAPPAPAPTFRRSLRWHSGGKYLDGTPIPPRLKLNTYTVEPLTAPKKVTAPSQEEETNTTSPEKNKERGQREELDISGQLSLESNPSLPFAPSQDTLGKKIALRETGPPLQEPLTPPPSPSPRPARRQLPHQCPEQLTFPQNQNNVSSPASTSNTEKGTPLEDEDTIMQEASPLDSRYISNAVDSWGTTREPVNKEGMVIAVSTSRSNDRKASLYGGDDLDGVLEEDVIRITNLLATALWEVCERKLAVN
ncbi:hypothetical protein HOY82DRAFT_538450 [Tuber indicum]|nr:hypothetical protein HOY82DRAFT_538450 [Tuber indicum]